MEVCDCVLIRLLIVLVVVGMICLAGLFFADLGWVLFRLFAGFG